MRVKSIILSLCVVSNLMALTIDEAVEIALEKSHLISSNQHKVDTSKASEKLAGSAYLPNLSLAYQYKKRDFENFISKKKESLFNANFDYNLFNGFYDKYTIKSQKHLTQAQKFLLASTTSDVIQKTKTSYLSLLQALQMREVANEAVTLLENQLKDSTNLFQQGLIPKSQYLKVKVELQNSKQEQLQAESDVVDTSNALSNLLHQEIDLKSLTKSDIKRIGFDNFQTLFTKSLDNRNEIKYLQALQESEKESIRAVNSTYYPKLNFVLDYNKYGDEVFPDKFSYGELGSIDDEVVGTINLSYDLFNGGRSKHQKAIHKTTILSLNEDIKNTEFEIKLQLQQALQKLKVTAGQIEVAKLSIEEAKEHYQMTNNRFKQQLDSTTDLLDARLLLTQAQNNLTQAEYEYQKAVVNLERVVEN
ncbi:MAG: TolC family protein [Epsilonproteobacteria bacterium]|nr:TolC family protein [Campylobacterota bacterium]